MREKQWQGGKKTGSIKLRRQTVKNKIIKHIKESKEKEEGLQSLPPTKAHPAMPPVKPPRQKSADADMQAKPASQ